MRRTRDRIRHVAKGIMVNARKNTWERVPKSVRLNIVMIDMANMANKVNDIYDVVEESKWHKEK